MKVKFKARRISGNDAVTFYNPHGEPVFLEKIGDVSQELEPGFAYDLLAKYPDVLEAIVEKKIVDTKKLETKAIEI